MSHFSVLVVLDEYSEAALNAALQPYHEYECTGVMDEYVTFVDEHDEVENDWNNPEGQTLWQIEGFDPVDSYDKRFYREPTPEEKEKIGVGGGMGIAKGISYYSDDWGDGKGYRPKVRMSDEERETLGYRLIKRAPKDDPQYQGDIRIYAEQYHGYDRFVDGRIGRMTNPNAKWDWFQVGGRYSGKFMVKDMAEAAIGERSWTNRGEEIEGVDICQSNNLDWDGMKRIQVDGRRKWIEEIREKSGLSLADLEIAIKAYQVAHKKWVELPEPKARGDEWDDWVRENSEHGELIVQYRKGIFLDGPDLKEDRTIEEWIQDAEPLTFFAILKDGNWSAEGDMGWWASVSNEDPEWPMLRKKLLDEIKPHQWLVSVDCHI